MHLFLFLITFMMSNISSLDITYTSLTQYTESVKYVHNQQRVIRDAGHYTICSIARCITIKFLYVRTTQYMQVCECATEYNMSVLAHYCCNHTHSVIIHCMIIVILIIIIMSVLLSCIPTIIKSTVANLRYSKYFKLNPFMQLQFQLY